jgi:hypothetical protein
LTVKANDNLWKASNDKATILKPGNINGPTPSSSSMFMFGTYSNTRGKKDAPPEDTQPQFSPSSLLGILTSDSILCWEARLHKSVVVPCSPSMDALIHSKSTTSAPSAADPGVSPHTSVSPFDEEKSILAAVQKSLSSAKAEAFHQGPNGGGTHLDFSATLTGLDDDTPVCVLPRYLVVTGPSALPLGIWSCPTLGAGALVNALRQQLDSNTQAPFQVLTSSVLFSLFLQAAAEYPADMVTPRTPVTAVQESLLASQSFVDSTACNIVYCAAQSATYCVAIVSFTALRQRCTPSTAIMKPWHKDVSPIHWKRNITTTYQPR